MGVMKGAYAVIECEDPELILVATGSEAHLCVDAAKEMQTKVRLVSMPCWELFRSQPESYKEALLPKSVPKMSVEAAVTMGWGEWADAFVGINVFGAGRCLQVEGTDRPAQGLLRCCQGAAQRAQGSPRDPEQE